MKLFVISLLFFSFVVQADTDSYKLKEQTQLLSRADEVPQVKKHKFKSFNQDDDHGDKSRNISSDKLSIEEFSTAQTSSVKLSKISRNQSSRFINYLAGNSIEVGIEYPLSFGVHFKSRMNSNFYFRAGSGFVTEFFLGSFSKLAPNLGYINEYEALLMADVFKNSLYGDMRLGWSPYYEKHAGGPYMEIGVSGIFFGKGEVSGFTIGKAMGIEGDLSASKYSVRSDVYSANFHVGYQIPIEKHININIEAGVLKIFKVKLKPTATPNVSTLPEEYHQDFVDFLIKKGWIFPTFSAWFAFSF